MRLASITDKGLLTVEFNHPMNTNYFLNMAKYSLEQLKQVINIEVTPGLGQSDEVEVSSFQVVSFDRKELKIQINFLEPFDVSTGKTLDTIHLKVKDKLYFITVLNELLDYGLSSLKIKAKRQEINPEQLAALKQGAETTKGGINTLVYLQLAGNLIMQQSLGPLFEMINNLQLTFHIPAINIVNTIPSNAATFNSVLLEVVLFDIIPEQI